MSQIEATIPDRLDVKITRLVDEGEFVNREEAVEQLLASGLRAYQTQETPNDGFDDSLDYHDDAVDQTDEYVF